MNLFRLELHFASSAFGMLTQLSRKLVLLYLLLLLSLLLLLLQFKELLASQSSGLATTEVHRRGPAIARQGLAEADEHLDVARGVSAEPKRTVVWRAGLHAIHHSFIGYSIEACSRHACVHSIPVEQHRASA